jgi:hypothetical protein
LSVVDSACSIIFTAYRGDFVTFEPSSGSSRDGGVGVDVLGSGTVHIAVPLVYGTAIRRIVHVLYIHDLSSRSAQRIGRLLKIEIEIEMKLKLSITCADKLDRLLSLGPLYFAIQDLLASLGRVSSTTYTYRHT